MRPETRIALLLKQLFWQVDKDQPPMLAIIPSDNHSTTNNDVPRKNEKFYDPYPVPQLPTLNEMVKLVKGSIPNPNKIAVVAIQHNLETTLTLIQAIQQLGIKWIFLQGKPYSDSDIIVKTFLMMGIRVVPNNKPEKPGQYQETARRDVATLWKTCLEEIPKEIDTIITLDDGGRCLAGMPPIARLSYKVAGIEQTRGGLHVQGVNLLPFPIVLVASSAVKRQIEPPAIARALLKKIDDLIACYQIDKNTVCGVVGNGAIGSAVATHLLSLGYRVAVFDEDDTAFQTIEPSHQFYRMPNIKVLLENVQCVFGCTGKDITQGLSLFSLVTKDTLFISCTSEDKEFFSTLKEIANRNIMLVYASKRMVDNSMIRPYPMGDFVCSSESGHEMVFINGGYPLNFDGKPWNVPAPEIEPTQVALLGAVVQAIFCARKPINDGKTINRPEHLMLLPEIQRFIGQMWRKNDVAKQYSQPLLDCFTDLEWIKKNSGGEFKAMPFLQKLFSQEHSLSSEDTKLFSIPRSRL